VRKQTIFARRLRGDIGPLNIDPVRGLMSRIIAPAVSITGEYQDYDQEDVTQNFRIGSRMQVDDRVYYYSQAVAAIVYPYQFRLCVSTDQILATNDMANTVATTVGGRTVTLTVPGGFGAVPENDLEGGYVECNSAGQYAWRRIVSNTVLAAGEITITVDRPWGYIFPVPSQFSIHKSIYRNVADPVTAALAGFQPAVGLPPITVQINYYFWLQTYGPCFIGPRAGYPLAAADFYDLYMYDPAGTTQSSLQAGIGATVSPQRIGHVMGSGNYGSGAVFLELAA